MTVATTQIIITAKDSTAAAFASVNSGLSGLSGAALKASSALSAIGATAALGSFVAFTKQTLDAQDSLSKLSQKTGIAVESLAGLEFAAEQSGVELDKVAKATRAFGLLVAEAADQSSGAATKLKQLGLSYKDLKDLSPEKQLLALADAFQKFSKEDRPIVFTSLFGNKMADLIPLLSGGSKELGALIEQGKKFNPVTEQSAKQAERFNDQLNVLNKSVTALGREFVQGMIPGLTRVADRMVSVTQQSGILSGALAGVKQLFVESFGNPKILGDVGQIRREIFKTQETIKSLEIKKDSVFFDKNALLHEQEKLVQLEIDLKKAIDTSREVIAAQDASASSTKKFAIALDDANKPLNARTEKIDALTKKINDQGRIESEYVKLLKIERQAQEDLLKPYQQSAASAQERLQSLTQEAQALDLSQREQISLAEAIEQTTIARLEEKRAITTNSDAIAEIDKEIAARKQIINVIKQGEDKTKGLVNSTKSATDDVSQLWMQAGRNIQSALANGIFNFFDDGLKGMVKNVASTVGRILSEFAALKLAQGIGLAGMFGAAGTASASTGGGSVISGALNLGSNVLSGIRGGFGIPSFIGNLGSSLPGSAGSFFGGLAGSSGTQAAAEAGAMALWGSSGASASIASAMGAGLAAAAGPLMVAFAATQGFKMLAGDKRLGGGFGNVMNKIGDIPILGDLIPIIPLINGLFGRGPMKQQGTLLEGQIGSEGFVSGMLQTRFKAKGGLFRSDKIDFSRVDAVTGETFTDNSKLQGFTEELAKAGKQVFDAINQQTKQTSSSLRVVAKDLGLATSGIDDFRYSLNILTDKGKMISEEQIGEEIGKISEALARSLLPTVDSFSKSGETAIQTVTRLSDEFTALSAGAVNLGASATFAKELISGMSIQARTALVDMAGGIQNIQTLTGYFAENYLTPAERIAPLIESLTAAAKDLGFAYTTDVTKAQVKALVQSQEITAETRLSLLTLVPTFDTVRNTLDAMSGATGTAADAITDFASIVQGLRSDLNSTYQSERSAIESTISRFKDLAGQLRSSRESLALGALSPLTPEQKLDEARNQLNRTRLGVANRDPNAFAKLPSVAEAFLQASQVYNASGAAFVSDFNLVQDILKNAEDSALSQVDIATNQLSALDKSVENLIEIKDNTKTVADLIRDLKIAVLSGPGNPGISTDQIKSYLSANPGLTPDDVAKAAAQYGVSGSQLSAAGYDVSQINRTLGGSSVTDQQIKSFVDANINNPMAIYNAAIQNGISSTRLSSASGLSLNDIQEFVHSNNLPSFDKGTDFISRSGLAMVHRAEAIVPSSTTDEIKKLREELAKLREEQNRQTGDMIKVTDITNRQNAQAIAKALADAERSRQWSDRSKAALA